MDLITPEAAAELIGTSLTHAQNRPDWRRLNTVSRNFARLLRHEGGRPVSTRSPKTGNTGAGLAFSAAGFAHVDEMVGLPPREVFHFKDVEAGYTLTLDWIVWVVALNDKARFELAAEYDEPEQGVGSGGTSTAVALGKPVKLVTFVTTLDS